MSRLVITGFSKYPAVKEEERLWQEIKEEKLFIFPSKDRFITWKFKRWAQEDPLAKNEFTQLVFQNVENALQMAKWPGLSKPSTEYGLILATYNGSAEAQVKFYQDVHQENIQYFNPKLFPEIYFNSVLNKLACKIKFRGFCQIIWDKAHSVENLLSLAIQAITYHSQKGCLIIVAEESSVEFGGAVVFIEKEKNIQ
ncbi:MAG: hypothetical protein KKA19_01620, partial [Candidatus Margulisbacteria bacterium]|nr:hypothetical protein [Candidatus Margulisiibacteriota bacterium]